MEVEKTIFLYITWSVPLPIFVGQKDLVQKDAKACMQVSVSSSTVGTIV